MDLYAQLTLIGLIFLFGIGIGIYFQKSKKANNLEEILNSVPEDFSLIKSVTLGGGSQSKRFVDAILIGKTGIYLVLYSDLRGQIQGVERSDKVKQVLGKTGVAVQNPVAEIIQIEKIFHEKMSIDYEYLKPVVVFDRQTDIRYESCSVPTIHMQDLLALIESDQGTEIPEESLTFIKEKFQIIK